jgi:hypothetical protein
MRFLVAAVLAVGAMLVPAASASAQPEQEGLVNVLIRDVEVAIPIAVAANVCDTTVNVLSQSTEVGPVDCDAEAESNATFGPGGNNGNANQSGLVNVIIEDVTILVPISVAANICDTTVNVLAVSNEFGRTECEATATSET